MSDVITRETERPQRIRDRADAYVECLNAKEVDRRIEANTKHRAEFGRDLYPEGGQYATFSLGRPGRRYTRVVMDVSGSHSVHAFIELATGDVLKSAGWKAPAAGARFNLDDDDSFLALLRRCEFAGGYLYANRAGA